MATVAMVSESGVGGVRRDATLVVLVSGHHDVAAVSPVSAPAVRV